MELRNWIAPGWPSDISKIMPELRSYFHIRDELVIEDDIYKGTRCIIPAAMRKDILTKLHSVHMGIAGTLRRARESVYWPGMNGDIKNYIEKCHICRENRVTSQQRETLQQHSRPARPWAKVGVDLFSLDKNNFLITVDYWSNYFELDQIMGETTSKKVVQCLRRHFATHGIPDTVISDNGPQFASEVFANFSKEWMFNHVTTSPYHSQSNGMVESSVKIAKKHTKNITGSKRGSMASTSCVQKYANRGYGYQPSTTTDVEKDKDTDANNRKSTPSRLQRF